MPVREAPCVELGSAPEIQSLPASSSPSDLSSTSSPEPHQLQATPLFRALAMPPLPPVQPDGQEELERRLPGYRRFVLPREQTLIEILKESSGVRTDEEVLGLRSVKIRVVAERVGLRRLHVLVPRLRILTLDGSALASLRDLGTGLTHLKELHICRCGLATLDGILGLNTLRELYASGNRIRDLEPLAALRKLHTLDLSNNPISESTRIWTLGVCGSLRRLCLRGSPVASAQDYHRRIASSLPALQYLDDFPLNESALEELDELFGPASSSSDSETENKINQTTQWNGDILPNTTKNAQYQDQTSTWVTNVPRRPATAPCASSPAAPAPAHARRPHTACASSTRAPVTGLELLNSLIDEESRCGGSDLTSGAALCGNVALALRPRRLLSASSTRSQSCSLRDHFPLGHSFRDRSFLHDRSTCISTNDRSTDSHSSQKPEKCIRNCTLGEGSSFECAAGCSCVGSRSMKSAVDALASAAQLVAAEIPIPGADWAAFRRNTGIEFDLTPDARPESGDPSEVISRLEKIEQETQERLRKEEKRMEEQVKKEEAERGDYKMNLLDKFLKE